MIEIPSFKNLRVAVDERVATVTIDAPPLNHFSIQLALDLTRLCKWLRRRADVAVVILQSDREHFFIPHLDLVDFENLPVPPPPFRQLGLLCMWVLAHFGSPGRWLNRRILHLLSPFHKALDVLSHLPQITIAVVEGRIGGIGSELAMSLDMRFADRERAVLNQLEVACGLFPGAGGTQRLPLLVGQGRAHEIIASSRDVDAESLTRWGYFNAALPSAELRGHVRELATRIARHPSDGLRMGTRLVRQARRPDERLMQLEAISFMRGTFDESVRARLAALVEAGGQQADGAARLGDLLSRLHR